MMKAFLVYKAAVPYLCVPALIGTAVVTHQVDRHVARQVRHAPVKRPPAKAKAARPAFHAERTGIAATEIKTLSVAAEAVALCPPTGLSGGGDGSGGFIGIGGAPPPVGVSPVPEPSTWFGMILGFGTFGIVMRRRRVDREVTKPYGPVDIKRGPDSAD